MCRVPSIPYGHPLAVQIGGGKNAPPPRPEVVWLVDDPEAVVKLITELKESANAAKATGGMTMQRPDGDDPLAQITKLKELADKGVISQDEFEKKKAELLERL